MIYQRVPYTIIKESGIHNVKNKLDKINDALDI